MRTIQNKYRLHPRQVLLGLKPIELAAIVKRYMGKSYRAMAKELNKEFGDEINVRIKEQLLRHWFMKRGRLYEAYLAYAERENLKTIRSLGDGVKSYLVDAVLTIRDILQDSSNPEAFRAAKLVIRTLWGNPTQAYRMFQKEQEKREQELKEAERRAHCYDGLTAEDLKLQLKFLKEDKLRREIIKLREDLNNN